MTDKSVVMLTRAFPAAVEERALGAFDARLAVNQAPLPRDEICRRAAGAAAVLCAPGDPFDAALISALPESVRILATFSVGTDHIDLRAAQARGLVVTNTPDVLTDATADIALLLILAACRRAYEGEALLRSGQWTGWHPTQLMGTHLGGRRLGIFGMGRIGQAIAVRARAFGLRIHYSNRRRLPADLEAGALFHPDPDDLLRVSEILALSAPATPQTENFLDARRIALLPRGAVIVNTARGSLVDDTALIAALRSGHLAGAGLDVYRGEPRVNSEYCGLANVTLLPHLGSATTETRNAMGFRALDNIAACLAGAVPPDRVV